MANTSAAKPPEPLSLEDRTYRGEAWKHFKRDWGFYEKAAKIAQETDDIRVAALLNVIGRDAVDLYETFEWIVPDDKWILAVVLSKFDEHCVPKTNETYESYKFFTRDQHVGESIDSYITALYKLADTCSFGALKDRLIKDRLVLGVKNDQIREKLLAKENLDLDKCINLLRTCHVTQLRAQEISSEASTHTIAKKSFSSLPKKRAYNQNSTYASKHSTPQRGANTSSQQQSWRQCGNCGGKHNKDKCPAYGKTCNSCGRIGHYAKVCRSSKPVHTTDDGDIHTVNLISRTKVHATCKVNDAVDVSFQLDTGSIANILSQKDYVHATGDKLCKQLQKTKTRLIMYNKAELLPRGQAEMKITRNGRDSTLIFVVVNATVVSLLGLQACVDMNLIRIIDADSVNTVTSANSHISSVQPTTRPAAEPMSKPAVSQTRPAAETRSKPAVSQTRPATELRSEPAVCQTQLPSSHTAPAALQKDKQAALNDNIIQEYSDVFEGLGCLSGDYHIQIDKNIKPVIHAPRKVPVAIRDTLRDELTRMVGDGIIEPVNEPTPWVSSMVVATKKNGALRVCLDPRDLNQAIQRSHYPLPTLEDVATRLTDARVFSVLDAKSGFWQIKLDEESSYLTTFNTPFGRFRWKRCPFGISSAPEEWQYRAHTIVEGLHGVEVIADDFLVIGYGKSTEDAQADHDNNLRALLDRARQTSLTLNAEKIQLRMSSVPFMGHLLTDQGLVADPGKIESIKKMPRPTDIKSLKRLLGMVNYLAKFLPHLSSACEPLRQLEHKDVEWCWLQQHDDALTKIKALITSAPVLAYFDNKRSVTVQCDASESGLGAVLLQNSKPVCYASRALTQAERNYAQIEKELLAIVFACERFDQYLYGRLVKVDSDHKPLEIITKKPLHNAPKRLQSMLLRLQRYDIEVTYKKGSEMYIADTLSRAYLPNVNSDYDSVFYNELDNVNMADDVPLDNSLTRRIVQTSQTDEELLTVMDVVRSGWPDHRSEVPISARAYFNCRAELTVHDGALFKGQCIVVPTSLRADMLKKLHSSHIGMEGCLRRAREAIYWPRMNQEVKDYISLCSTCNTFKPEQCREPIIQHEIPTRPWSRVGVDLFELDNKPYLITVDYFSNFFEVDYLTTTTATQVITKLRIHFARYGIPDTVVTDNGPQFSCEQFKKFASDWQFKHSTSSPYYAQSNGKVENSVKTAKNIMKKAAHSKSDVYLAFLDFRNTPTELMNSSPAQRMLARRTRSLLPLCADMLKPDINGMLSADAELRRQKSIQAAVYNRKSQPLQPLNIGGVVRMRLPQQREWSLARVTRVIGPRSYLVECGGSRYRRNRRQLRCTTEAYRFEQPQPSGDANDDVTPDQLTTGHQQRHSADGGLLQRTPEATSTDTHQPPGVELATDDHPKDSVGVAPAPAVVRSSGRVVKPPAKFSDYHM